MNLPTVRLGFGGSYRRELINTAHVVSYWPLNELANTVIRDAFQARNPGTLVGTTTRGASLDLPERGLGMTFTGAEYITVADDGDGYNLPNDAGDRALSCTGGSIDVCFLIKTSTNDATLRAIIQKQVTNSAGDGWHVALQSGAIVFYLEASGVAVFNFSRGSIADGAWHVVHCYFDPSAGKVRIYIDGAQSGAEVTGATTEPEKEACTLRIGMFTDGAGGFIGALAHMLVGREGDATLSGRLEATRVWTDVTSDVLLSPVPMDITYGIDGADISARVAGTGTCSLALNNSKSNSGGKVGYYSPEHADVRSGFTLGIPISVTFDYDGDTYEKFHGWIDSIQPLPGASRERHTLVTAVDWMDVAALTFSGAIGIETNITMATAVKLLVQQATYPPGEVTIDDEGDTIPYAFDSSQGENTPIMEELARLAISELGHVYMRGGGSYEFRFETRLEREANVTAAWTLTNTMEQLSYTYTRAAVWTRVHVTVTPRAIDPSAVVLFSLAQDTVARLDPETISVFEANYVDPNNPEARVGGTSMVTPVATTDYQAWENEEGTSGNHTADILVRVAFGANLATVEIENPGGSGVLYLTKFQLRGIGLYADEPVTVVVEDLNATHSWQRRTLVTDLPYQSDIQVAGQFGNYLLGAISNPQGTVEAISFCPEFSDALMEMAIVGEVGDRVALAETVTSPNTDGFYIQKVALQVTDVGLRSCTWGLLATPRIPAWLIGTAGYSELGDTTYLGL